jgi:hypothetical protein
VLIALVPAGAEALLFWVSTSDQPVTGKDEDRHHWRGHQAEYETVSQTKT